MKKLLLIPFLWANIDIMMRDVKCVEGAGRRAQGSKLKAQGSRLKAQSSRLKAQGTGCKVQGSRRNEERE
ncbi:MAG: hypothetical protein JW927_07400 [Deltaproteobacteria bacterium]|nr:hypothetical protein [Deltaproteobacteria bacterium]